MTRVFPDPIAWEATLPIRPSSPAWRATIKALYGAPLESDERALFGELSGGRTPPADGADELLAVVGRRGGKSEQIARLAVFEAIHGGHEMALAPGQIGLIPVISPLRDQSQEILNFVRGLVALPQVRRHVEGEPTRDGVAFKNRITIRVLTADSVAVSGPTCVGAILDEFAKFPGDDAVTPDREIVNSLRPALAPVAGAARRRFICITSAYIQEGLAFETDRDHWGRDDSDVLVIRGASELFNPSLDDAWLKSTRKKVGDAVFAREYLGTWQPSTVDGYFAQVLERAVDRGRDQSAPRNGVDYVVAIDPAWKKDLFAMAVAHRESQGDDPPITIVDGVHAWQAPKGGTLATAPTIAEVKQFADAFGTHVVYTDQASATVLAEECRRHGLVLIEIPWKGGTSAESKSSRFRQVHSGMADGVVRLPDDQATLLEFSNVGSRLLRSGAEQIEGRHGHHDDRVSAVVLACTKAQELHPAPPIGSAGGANQIQTYAGGWSTSGEWIV